MWCVVCCWVLPSPFCKKTNPGPVAYINLYLNQPARLYTNCAYVVVALHIFTLQKEELFLLTCTRRLSFFTSTSNSVSTISNTAPTESEQVEPLYFETSNLYHCIIRCPLRKLF